MQKHRIYTMSFAAVYPCYIAKAEKKGRKQEEVNEIIFWMNWQKEGGWRKSCGGQLNIFNI